MRLKPIPADRPAGTPPERRPVLDQVLAFEGGGAGPSTDDKRRPLRVLGHFNQQLWLPYAASPAPLPFQAEDNQPRRLGDQDGRRRGGAFRKTVT